MMPITIIDALTIGTSTILSNQIFVKLGYLGLFINSLLSSVIPIPTELTTSALLLAGQSKTVIFTILAIGSVIGGLVAYCIGYGGGKFLSRFGRSPTRSSENRSISLLKKYGWVILFISPWIPIVGDSIPIIAGVTKYNFRLFSIAIISGKLVKAVAIVFFGSLILPLIFPSSLHHP